MLKYLIVASLFMPIGVYSQQDSASKHTITIRKTADTSDCILFIREVKFGNFTAKNRFNAEEVHCKIRRRDLLTTKKLELIGCNDTPQIRSFTMTIRYLTRNTFTYKSYLTSNSISLSANDAFLTGSMYEWIAQLSKGCIVEFSNIVCQYKDETKSVKPLSLLIY